MSTSSVVVEGVNTIKRWKDDQNTLINVPPLVTTPRQGLVNSPMAGAQSNVFAQLWKLARGSARGRTMGDSRERMVAVGRVARSERSEWHRETYVPFGEDMLRL
jgi:hypothetical protein